MAGGLRNLRDESWDYMGNYYEGTLAADCVGALDPAAVLYPLDLLRGEVYEFVGGSSPTMTEAGALTGSPDNVRLRLYVNGELIRNYNYDVSEADYVFAYLRKRRIGATSVSSNASTKPG